MRGYRHGFHHPETHALHIHRVFGNLQTWLNGTHHGVDAKYLQNYLDEFVFRFNRRKTPMAAFQTLLGLTTQRPHVSLKKMTDLIQRDKHIAQIDLEAFAGLHDREHGRDFWTDFLAANCSI
jgi:hypothetical protein